MTSNKLKHKIKRLLNPRGNYYSLLGFKSHKFIFVHIPKTGGIAVLKSLVGSLGAGHSNMTWYKDHLSVSQYRTFLKVTIVRDPIERFISAINFLALGGLNEEDKKWSVAHYTSGFDINQYVQFSLEQHISTYVHLRSQSSFLKDDTGAIDMDFIGRFETLEQDYQHICQLLSVRKPLLRKNVTGVKTFSIDVLSVASVSKLKELYADDYRNFKY